MRRFTATAIVVALAALAAIPAVSASAASGLDAEERATLQAMREEEKLAHDVYLALARATGDSRFTRISAAETQHGAALERMLAAYGVADPTDGFDAGTFPTPAFQRLYDELVARGSVSLSAALAVGREIERLDIDGLGTAIAATDEPALDRVYTALRAGSTRHLAAFSRTSARGRW